MKPSTIAWIGVPLIGAILAYLLFAPAGEMKIADAVRAGKVQVTARVVDKHTVAVTVASADGAALDRDIVIPAGTVLNGFQGTASTVGVVTYQRLMTARTTVVHFGGGDSTMTVNLPVYCLDQFAEPPPQDSQGALQGDSADEDDAAMADARKLALCIDADDPRSPPGSSADAKYDAQQQFIWVLKGSYQNMTYSDAKTAMRDHYFNEMAAEFPGMHSAGMDAAVGRNAPNLDADQIQDAENKFSEEDRTTATNAKADEVANNVLSYVVSRDGMAWLNSCGIDVSTAQLFQSPPQ
jgi:hypothetical protein